MKAVLEKVKVGDESSVHAFFYDRPEFDAPWHFHPEYELTYIQQSQGMRYVGDHVATFEPGELVLLGPNLPHCWKNTDVNKAAAQSYVIQWEGAILADVPELEAIRTLLTDSGQGLLFNPEVSTQALPLIRRLPGADAIDKYLLLIELLHQLYDQPAVALAGASYAYDLSQETGKRLDKIQSFVKTHYRRKIRLRELAELVSMTEPSFSRFFSKTMQRPFFVFLNEYRINIASRMLIETDQQVAEIGYSCGYETLPFFYQQFKKFKGYSPLAFRKLYHKGAY